MASPFLMQLPQGHWEGNDNPNAHAHGSSAEHLQRAKPTGIPAYASPSGSLRCTARRPIAMPHDTPGASTCCRKNTAARATPTHHSTGHRPRTNFTRHSDVMDVDGPPSTPPPDGAQCLAMPLSSCAHTSAAPTHSRSFGETVVKGPDTPRRTRTAPGPAWHNPRRRGGRVFVSGG